MVMMSKFNKILLIKWGALGDILTVTIAIKALRATYPNSELVLLTNKMGCDVFAHDDSLKTVYDQRQLEVQHGKLGMLKFLRQQHFDVAVNFRWYSARCVFIAYFSAKKAVGYGPDFWRFLYHYKAKSLPITTPSLEYSIIAEHVKAIGCQVESLQGYLSLGLQDRAFADQFFHEQKLDPNNTLLIAPGASNRCKCWPIENFIAVCEQFQKKYPDVKILLNWMPGDEDMIQKCQRALPNIVLQPRTTIGQVCALVEKSSLVLCNNSGLMNAAYMLQKPIVCINTAYHWTIMGKNIVSIDAFSQDKKGLPCTPKTETEVLSVLKTIKPDTVSLALKNLWSQLRKKND